MLSTVHLLDSSRLGSGLITVEYKAIAACVLCAILDYEGDVP